MTTIELQLSDSLVNQAKQAGIYNEKTLANKLHEFLVCQLNQHSQIHQSQSSVYDFLMSLPKAEYQEDGLKIQQRMRDEW